MEDCDDDLLSQQERFSPKETLCTSAQLQLSFAPPQSESTILCSQWSKDELMALVQFVIEKANGKSDTRATQQSAHRYGMPLQLLFRGKSVLLLP